MIKRFRYRMLCCLALIVSATTQALPPAPAAPQSAPIAITGVTIHVGDGSVIENGTVTFTDGVITGVFAGAEQPDLAGHQVLVKTGEHLYPGFILPNTRLGLREVGSVNATRDAKERGPLNASVNSMVAYNTDSELLPTFRFNGVLTAQVTPLGSLIAGNSSIMQLDAWNWEDAVIQANDAMHINWPELVKRKTDVLKQEVTFEVNENYEDDIELINALFSESSLAQAVEPSNLNVRAVKAVLSGERQLFIHAEDARQLVDAIQFVKHFEIPKAVLVGASEALQVKALVLDSGLPILVQFVHGLPRRAERHVDESYERAAKFIQAGFTIGLAAKVRQEPSSGRNLPFMAGTVAAYGVGKEQAVGLITLGNARLLGISDSLGSIEVGKQATLFTSKGDALDMRTNKVSSAFIQGRTVAIEGMQQELYGRFKDKYAEAGKP